MDKKDLYEHLANIYLDASLDKKKKNKVTYKFKNLFILSLVATAVLSGLLAVNLFKAKHPKSSFVALVLYPDPVKINFNFDPAKKEIYSINLKKLNLAYYKQLAFSVKKSNYSDILALRVELSNVFNEKSFVYLRDISAKWKEFKVNFSDFSGLHDWSEMSNLSFIVEEWNAREKKDVIYIDNIRVLR